MSQPGIPPATIHPRVDTIGFAEENRLVGTRRGLSLLELLVAIAVVAILMALLVPALVQARRAAATSVCASNIRQLALGWASYTQTNERFPAVSDMPAWNYGGVRFINNEFPVLDEARPLNDAIADSTNGDTARGGAVYHCPSDTGVITRDPSTGNMMPVTQDDCFRTYGTSYRANDMLLDARLTGLDTTARPLRPVEITTTPSRMLILGDPAWYFETLPNSDPASTYEANWHGLDAAGQVATMDTAVRLIRFNSTDRARVRVHPRVDAD